MNLSSSSLVLSGSFRTPANKGLSRPRVESLRVKSTCVSSGLAFPIAKEVGEASHNGMNFGARKSVDLWGVKR